MLSPPYTEEVRNAPLRDPGRRRVACHDGTSDALSTGIHFKVKSPGGGVIFRRIGLQILHFDASGELISIEIVGGNFDPLDEFAGIVCGAPE
jgi:hypothetical protein